VPAQCYEQIGVARNLAGAGRIVDGERERMANEGAMNDRSRETFREIETKEGNEEAGTTPKKTVTGADGRFSGASEELRAKLQRRRSTLHDPSVIANVLSAVAAAAAVEGTVTQNDTSTLESLEARRAALEAEMDACLEAPDPENEITQATAARVWAEMEAVDSAISNYIAEFRAKELEVEDNQQNGSNDFNLHNGNCIDSNEVRPL